MTIPFTNPEQNNQMPSFQQEPQPVIRSHPPATNLRQINPSSSQHAPRMHQNASSIPQNNHAITEASPEKLLMRRRLGAAANPQQNQSAGFSLGQQRETLAYLQQHAQQNLQGQNVNHLGPHRQQLLSQRQQQNVGQNVNLLASNHQQLWNQRQPQNPGQNVNRLGPHHQQTLSQRQQQTLGQNAKPFASNPQQLMSQRWQQTFGQNVNLLALNHQQLSSQRQPQNLGQNAHPLTLNHQQLSSQRQPKTRGQNVNLSGPHHVESSQRSMVTTQQQTCYRQMNTSNVQTMQMPQTQQNGQPTHHMTGKPASTLSSGNGEMYGKVQILKTNYVRPLTSIYQKLDICLRNLDKQNVRKFEQVVKMHQLVANILKVLDKMEKNIAGITEKNLDDIENRIKFILSKFADKKPVSTSVQHENSSVNVHAMSQQSVQLDSQTAQARTNQDKMKQPINADSEPKTSRNKYAAETCDKLDPRFLTSHPAKWYTKLAEIKDSDQTSLPGNSKMPTHSLSQSVKIPVHGQVSASDPNILKQGTTQPKQMHPKQQDMQTEKLKQPLLQQNPQPVRPHPEAFPHLLAQNHASSGQQVPRNTSQSEKNSLPPPSFSSSAPKDTPPMPVNSERPTSEAAVHSSVGNIGDEEVRGPAEAPSSTTSVPVNSEIPMSDTALQSSCVGNIVDEQVIAPPEAPLSSITSPEKPNDAIRCETSTENSDEVPPIQRLIKAISSISNRALVAGASDIASVVYDRFDMKRRRWTFPDTDADAAAASGSETCRAMKRPRRATKEVIEEEIETINEQLCETEVNIIPSSAAEDEGITVLCRGYFREAPFPGSMPSQWVALRILVPADYPSQSPKVLDNLNVEAGHEFDNLSTMVLSKLGLTLRTLEEPFSLEQIAVLYDKCARQVVGECLLQQYYGKGSPIWAKWKNYWYQPIFKH